MSQKKMDEFNALVDAVIKAVNEYREARLFPDRGNGDWFLRGLDVEIKNRVHELLTFGRLEEQK